MPTTQINQLPAGTAHVDAIVAADNATLTTTEKIKLGDIAKLATDASQLTTGTLPDARLSANIVRTTDVRLSDARTPLSHNQAAETITTGTLSDARLSANVPLLVNGLISASVLPSFVDDVLEYNDVASFPATGEANKIYVVLTGGNANKIYRWSGSAYVEVSPSPGSTDAVPEGSSNLYFTNSRASSAAPVQSVAGKTGAVTLAISDVSGLQTALDSITSDPRWNLFLPAAPTNLSGVASNAQVALTWTAPTVLAQAPITDYSLQYKVNGAESWTAFSDGTSTAASATVTGLTNGTAYVFRVAAVNGIGAGPYSAPSNAFTPITTPNAPTSLSATAAAAALSLTWTAPTSNGGSTITGYRIEYTASGGSAQTLNTGTTATSYELSGLANDTAYTVRVAAINAAGDGSYSSPAYGTPVAPTPVITITGQPSNQTASGGSATFSVTATVTQSATLSYQWQKQESGTGSFAAVSGATSSSLALTGLTNAADNADVYRCVVSATGGAESVTSSSATLTVAASGPLIGGGQILNSFALSGAPNPWGNVVDVNGTYVDEGSLSPASPGYGWVIDDGSSQYGGNLRITWWSDQGSCTCYDGNYNVLGTRQLGAGWVLWGGYSDMIAFAPGPNASIPPSTGWYKIYMAGGTPACSGPFGGDYSTPYGFSDCDPSIQPPTENWQPGFVTNLTFTPA